MRARAAYIRSIGTTSILVAAALLMLGVVGALVGFHGWPEGAVGETVPAVPLKPTPQPVLRAVRDVRKTPVARQARLLGDSTATVGLVKQVPARTPQAIGYPVAVTPGEAAPAVGAPAPASQGAPHVAPPDAPGQPVPPLPPADPEDIQLLVSQLLGSVPPPPEPDQSLQVGIPIVGATVTIPPVRAR